jgi:hypothetical protein
VSPDFVNLILNTMQFFKNTDRLIVVCKTNICSLGNRIYFFDSRLTRTVLISCHAKSEYIYILAKHEKLKRKRMYLHKCACMQWLYTTIQGFGSDELACSRYNCTHTGSLLIDLIGVSSGGCCHSLVSDGIHSSASLLVLA